MALLLSVSHFTFVIAVSLVVATRADKYDLCGFGDVDKTNGSIFLEVSESDSSSKLLCTRVIRINKPGRLQLNITDFRLAPQDSFEIFDGPNPDVRRLTTNITMQPVASGNVVLIRFRRASDSKVASSHFLASFHAVRYPEKCLCRPVKNGVLECSDKYQERICQIKCNDGYYDISLGKDITCDMHEEGKWNVDIHGRVLSCQRVSPPMIRLELSLHLNGTCEGTRVNNTKELFKQFLGTVPGVQKFGKCFANNQNCAGDKIAVKCGPRTISVNITDEVKGGDEDNFEKLYQVYGGLDFGDVSKKLSELNNVTVASLVKEPVAPRCQDTSQSFFKLLVTSKRNFSNVCSSCPLHHFYNSRTGRCDVCREGSTAPEGSSSCVNGSSPAVPIQHNCETRCMLGKQYVKRSGFCEWCPLDQYQDSTELNPKCQQCPQNKVTPFGGADDLSKCISECHSGEFYNIGSSKCDKCPLDTYQDNENLFTRCKPCGHGRHTTITGSTKEQQCLGPCTPGQFFDEQTRACKKCPKHSYQDEVAQNQCKNCTNGKMTVNPGAKDESSCIIPCKAGQLFNAETERCGECSRGSFQDQDNHLESSCKPCGSGKTTEGRGAKKESDCILACDAGQFAENGKQCVKCPRGYFQDLPNQSSCKKCTNGKTTRKDGQKNVTACVYLCPSGTFLDAKKNCSSCPFGTYQDATDHSLTACIQCPSGETSDAGGATSADSCLMNCGLYPCRHGARCIPKEGGFLCDCGHGLRGGRCEVIENKNQLRAVEISLDITSLDWVEQLDNHISLKYNRTKGRIESEIRQIMEGSVQYIAVEVTDLRKASVVAFMTLYFGQNSDPVPAGKLQAAAAQGTVGNLVVGSLRILHQTCRGALGMEAGYIKDNQITVSGGAGKGRLNGSGWQANKDDAFLQINFQRRVNITAVASQGISSPQECYVSSYGLAVSEDGKVWDELAGKIFTGNNNSYEVVRNDLESPVLARFIRFKPLYLNEICMRVEVYGCLLDPTISADVSSTFPPASFTTTAAAPSVVHKASASKAPLSWGAYLGIACFALFLAGAAIAMCCWKRKSKSKKLDHSVEMETLLDISRNPGRAAGGYKYTRRRDNDNPEDQEVIEVEENRL